MLQNSNKKTTDDWIEKNWAEIEPKIVKEICKEFNLGREYESKSLDDIHMGLGFVHIIWKYQKIVLERDYGISWESPAELNPDILFD